MRIVHRFFSNISRSQRHSHNRGELDVTRRGGIPRRQLYHFQSTPILGNPIAIGRLVPGDLGLNEQFPIVTGDVFRVERDGGDVRNNVSRFTEDEEGLPRAQSYEGSIALGCPIIPGYPIVQGYSS